MAIVAGILTLAPAGVRSLVGAHRHRLLWRLHLHRAAHPPACTCIDPAQSAACGECLVPGTP